MHADEHVSTADQVARLVAAQLPQWGHLPVAPVAEFGTDHCLFRLGDELLVRMPRAAWAVGQAASDAAWLARLAPYLPVDVPAPVALGHPGEGFPWAWSVVPWLPGRPPTAYDEGRAHLADDLATFVRALQAAPTDGGPVAQPGTRGGPLAAWDDAVRSAIVACGSRIDPVAVTEAWEHCVAAPAWDRPGVWIHGDLMVGNLLVSDDRLTAVIDFGSLGVGDPAPDLLPAWCVLAPSDRERFRDLVGCDDDTWRRSRGWALGPALTGIPYYWDSVPAFAERGLRTIDVVLADLGISAAGGGTRSS